MTAARFESVGEDAAAKATGGDELEAAAKPARNDAQSVEQDETEAPADIRDTRILEPRTDHPHERRCRQDDTQAEERQG